MMKRSATGDRRRRRTLETVIVRTIPSPRDAASDGEGPLSAARRLAGGTLLACGTASGLFFALLSGWFGIELLRDIVDSGWQGKSGISGVFRMPTFGVLAVGLGIVAAGLGRLILGPRRSA